MVTVYNTVKANNSKALLLKIVKSSKTQEKKEWTRERKEWRAEKVRKIIKMSQIKIKC